MKGLIAYSGLTTKIRVMKGNLISQDEYLEIASVSNISEMVAYLSKHPGYNFLLTDLDYRYVSRAALEELIVYSPCADLNRIFTFSNQMQKKFVDNYYIYFQVRFLKRAIRKLYNNFPIQSEAANMEKLFDGHEKFDFKIIAASESIDDLIQNLKGTIFFEAFDSLKETDSLSLFDYEIALDLFYFKNLWNSRLKINTKTDSDIITLTYGKQIDMMNLMLIYRLKKYYSIPSDKIKSFLIPVKNKIKDSQLEKLINSEDMNEFQAALKSNYYGKFFNFSTQDSFEYSYRKIMIDMHKRVYKNNPYSISSIITYLYLKDEEVKKLTTIAECIRYKYPPDKIISTLNKIGGAG